MKRLVLLCLIFVGLFGVVSAQTTPTPSPEQTAEPEPVPRVLDIWLPDVIAPPGSNASIELLRQIEAFADSTQYSVNVRLKRVGEVGGIMSTLRTASDVAPGALPDLTLVRRQDLVAAERAGLITSVENMISSSVQSDLDSALRLGQVDGTLVGIPYLLDVLHVVTRETLTAPVGWAFDDVLESGESLVFPAGRLTGVNDVFLAQYLTANDTIAPDGTLTLNPAALRDVLEFYEAASDSGVINGQVLNYTSASDYQLAFQEGDIDVAVFSSSMYFGLLTEGQVLQIQSIPTIDGTPTTVLNGWMWVVVTTEDEQLTAVRDFLSWMLETDRQAAFTQNTNFIPSLRSALEDGLSVTVDGGRYVALLDRAVVPITDGDGGTLARAMQEALQSVLTKEKTAEEAAATVVSQQGQTSAP